MGGAAAILYGYHGYEEMAYYGRVAEISRNVCKRSWREQNNSTQFFLYLCKRELKEYQCCSAVDKLLLLPIEASNVRSADGSSVACLVKGKK